MPKVPSRREQALPDDYPELLADIKSRVSTARARAMTAVNSELICLYWEIGQQILAREQQQGWGAKVIERLAADLDGSFPT